MLTPKMMVVSSHEAEHHLELHLLAMYSLLVGFSCKRKRMECRVDGMSANSMKSGG